ncbi:MAG: archaetidylserine decarboxylase [Gemmatimonadaceae bacterium]
MNGPMNFGRLLILVLSVLPRHGMSRVAGWIANRPVPRTLRGSVYRGYARIFGARPEDAELPLEEYASINKFFTRKLRDGLRPIAPDAIVSPADSGVGAFGVITNDTLVQAKGRNYSLAALLGDKSFADRFEGGTFATFYLAPKDYHRVHSPVDGEIVSAKYIPGELWPVNVFAVAHVADLFAVNERIVVEIARPNGGVAAVVFVGATMVGMTRLVFDDMHTNARRREVQERRYQPPIAVSAGGPLGHFEFGSTIVMACSKDGGGLEALEVGQTVKMGERVGR